MLTGLLVNSALDQAIVLATSEEAPPSVVPQGVKFLNLIEGTKTSVAQEVKFVSLGTKPCEAAVSTAV